MKSIRLFSMVACAAMTAPIFGQQAFAQTDTSAGVETITVTAERRSENIQAVPESVTAFNAKQITDMGINASTDIAQHVANLDIALPAGAGNQPIITIRGIGLNDYDTNNAGPNGVYLDEVYLSSPASQTFQAFDLSDIEVLKGPQGTLFGRNASGGAVLFSSAKPTDDFTADFVADYSSYNTVNLQGGVGGPITDDLDYRFAFQYNNSGGYMHNLFTGGSENGENNWASRIMLQWKPNSSWRFLFNVHGGQVANRPNEYRHLGAVSAPFFSGGACTSEATAAGQCVDLYGYGTPSKFFDGAWSRREHLDVNNFGTNLNAQYQWGTITFTSITAYDHSDKIHPENTDAAPDEMLDINFGVRNDTITQEFRASQQTDTYDWQAGFYYLWEGLHQNQPLFSGLDFDSTIGVPGICDYPAGPFAGLCFQAFDQSYQVTNAYAVYAQGDYKITDKLKVTLGARGTYESKTFRYLGTVEYQDAGQGNFGPLQLIDSSYHTFYSGAFNYKAVVDYSFTDDVHAYGSISTGYKSADFNGSFLSNVPAITEQQLQPVKPEYVTAYEVGVKSSWFDNKLVLDGAAFYNDYRDMQLFLLAPPPASACPGPGCLPNNVLSNADALTAGSDISIIGNPFEGFTAKADIGILTTKIVRSVGALAPGQPSPVDEQLTLSPHSSASLTLDYTREVPGGVADVQFNANYKGHQFFDLAKFQNGTVGSFLEDPYTQQNGYWLVNARASYAFEDGRWEVAVFGRNLLNKQYYLDEFNLQNPYGFIQGIVGTPRVIGGEIDFKY
jgi:iron complex outermembrane receptor protein